MAETSDSGSSARDTAELEGCIHGVAHDLRGPLCSARGFARLLERDFGGALGEIGRGYVQRVRDGLDRIQGLLDGLLDLSRLRCGVDRRTFAPTLEVLRGIAAELKPELEERDVRLELPEVAPAVWADPLHLYQVISNLVANAVRHMGDGPNRRVRIAFDTEPGAVVLVVSDNGCGIAADDQARVFQPFVSLDPAARGAGLGLAIVRRIAEAHGGRVELRSAPGAGAEFRVSFPNP